MIRETHKVNINRLPNAIFISPSGKFIGACTPDHHVYIWNEFGKQILKRKETSEIKDLLVFQNESEIAYICGGKKIVTRNFKDEETWNMKIDITCLASSKDGKYLSGGTNFSGDKNNIYIIDRESSGLLSRKKGKISYKEKVPAQCSTTAISPNGDRIAFGFANSNISILDPEGNHLFDTKSKNSISKITFTENNEFLVSDSDGYLSYYSENFEEKWTRQLKEYKNLNALISENGKFIIACSMEKEILLMKNKGEAFWRIKLKYPAPRIAINSEGKFFAFAISTDISIRKYINQSTSIENLIPFYVQKLIRNDDPQFALKMIKKCGSASHDELINAMKQEKLNEIHLEKISPFLDTTFFKKLLNTFLDDFDNLPIIKAIDILNNYNEDLSQILFDSMADNVKLHKKMLDKISDYAFQRESPSIYRLLGIIYFKLGDYYSSSKYLTESLMFEGINDNTAKLLTEAQQNYNKEVTLSKLKHNIYLPFSAKLFQ